MSMPTTTLPTATSTTVTSLKEKNYSDHQDHFQLENLLKSIEEHDKLRAFLDPNFNASTFASMIVAKDSTRDSPEESNKSLSEEYLQLIRAKIPQIENLINSYVKINYENLLHRAGSIVDLKNKTTNVHVALDDLNSSINRIQKDIVNPYEELIDRTNELERIHQATTLLRKISRFHQLLGKLKNQFGSSISDQSLSLSTTARLLHEMQQILSIPSISEIEVIANEVDFVTAAVEQVQVLAERQGKENGGYSFQEKGLGGLYNANRQEELQDFSMEQQ